MKRVHPLTDRIIGAALATAAASFAATAPATAAVISFSTPTVISGNSDVINVGAVLAAYSFGPNAVSGTGTVNGVAFSNFTAGTSPDVTLSSGWTDTSANSDVIGVGSSSTPAYVLSHASDTTTYADILNTSAYYVTPSPYLTLSGLTQGTTYEVEIWATDGGSGKEGRAENVSDGSLDSPVTLTYSNTDSPAVAGGLGEFTVGTFMADATTQEVLFSNYVGTNQVNALVLEAVPEPTTVGFLVAAGAGMLLRRRRSARKIA